jgi:hypothetical protein
MSCIYYCTLCFAFGAAFTFLYTRHALIAAELSGLRADLNRLIAAFAETQNKT